MDWRALKRGCATEQVERRSYGTQRCAYAKSLTLGYLRLVAFHSSLVAGGRTSPAADLLASLLSASLRLLLALILRASAGRCDCVGHGELRWVT